jgi:Probable cobalt transporter subunit (CbtB)
VSSRRDGTGLWDGSPRPSGRPSADPGQERFADGDNRKSVANMATDSPSNIHTAPRPDAARVWRAPIALPVSAGAWWLVAAVLFSLLLYYFVGIDQGAVSAFGRDMHIHEFVHDGRHFLSFPCH